MAARAAECLLYTVEILHAPHDIDPTKSCAFFIFQDGRCVSMSQLYTVEIIYAPHDIDPTKSCAFFIFQDGRCVCLVTAPGCFPQRI
jgi:hypothetical protein